MTIAIVGAGAAGLSLGMMLKEAGVDFTIFEKSDRPGGLCQSTREHGFTFDRGPHILGGLRNAVEWIMETTGIGFVEGETRNVGWLNHEFVDHPFDDPVVGHAYMHKMWKTDPDGLSLPGLNAQTGRKPGGVSTFFYPLAGGYQAIIRAWASRLRTHICYGEEVDINQLPVGYDGVVWTAPSWGERYNDLLTITLAFRGPELPYTAIYCPEESPPFHRLSFPAAFSSNNAPPGHWLVQGEVSFFGHRPDVSVSQLSTLMREILQFGRRSLNEPVASWRHYLPNAYPVPLEDTRMSWRRPDFWPHGRTGSHSYLNLDGVVKQSMDLAAELTA